MASEVQLLQAILEELQRAQSPGGKKSGDKESGKPSTGTAQSSGEEKEALEQTTKAASDLGTELENQKLRQDAYANSARIATDALDEQKKAMDFLKQELKEIDVIYNDLTESTSKAFAKELKEQQIIVKHAELELAQLTHTLREQGATDKEVADGTEHLRKKLIEAEHQFKLNTKALEGEKGLTEQLERLGQTTFGLGLKNGSAIETVMNLKKQFLTMKGTATGPGGLSRAMGKVSKSLGRAGFLKVAELAIGGTMKLITAQDEAISSFRKATGASTKYNLEIAQTERRNFLAGVSAADAGKAFQALYSSFSQFTELSSASRQMLVDTAVLYEKLGVSAGTAGKIFDQLSRSLGQGPRSIQATMLRIGGAAASLEVPMDKMASDFEGAFAELSKYGEQAIDVFEDLAKQAKATGIAVGKLMSITKQFDTFEGAATSVGKLNAILGGPYLNSIDMLNAKEGERLQMIRDTVDASGMQFDAMNRFEKQAIASALGMSVDEASRIMKMSTAEYELQAQTQKEVEEQARSTQKMVDQLKSAFAVLAKDLRPFVEQTLVPMIKVFATFAGWLGKAINMLPHFATAGLMAAGVAAMIAAPFTGGASIAMWAGIAGTLGAATFGLASAGTKKVNDVIITSSGQVIEPSEQDFIVAAEPGGPLFGDFTSSPRSPQLEAFTSSPRSPQLGASIPSRARGDASGGANNAETNQLLAELLEATKAGKNVNVELSAGTQFATQVTQNGLQNGGGPSPYYKNSLA